MFVPKSLRRHNCDKPKRDDEAFRHPSDDTPAIVTSGGISGTAGLKEDLMRTLFHLTESVSILKSPLPPFLLPQSFWRSLCHFR